MAIIKLKPAEVPPETAARLREATFLGSIQFASLWESIGGQPVCWAVEAGGGLQAALAGVEFGSGRFMRFQSMPDGLYSRAIILDRTVDIQDSAKALLKGIARAGYAKAYVNDYYGLFHPADDWQAFEECTILVDVAVPEWQPPDKKIRSEIRRAEREGTKLQTFDASRHLDSFLRLMQRTEKRHGRGPKYPALFFRALADLAERDSRVRWVIVEHEGEAAASHIYFIEGGLLLNWQVYFDKKFSFLKPNQFITSTVAIEAASQGIRYLNLGASPVEADSLRAYKMKWGGKDHAYRCLQKKTWLGRIF